MTRLRIAVIGLRGVPATVGGIERHVEELGARLAARGHEVTVFCRTNYVQNRLDEYRGMRLRHLPTVGTKHLDAIAHSALSTMVAMGERPDIVHYHAIGPGLMAPLPSALSRARVVLTVHGLDQDRAKWGRGARVMLRTAGWMSARVPDATITVSAALAEHYRTHYGRDAVHIPNGVVAPQRRDADEIVQRFGLRERGYALFVGRLVPEKAPDMLLRAFRRVPGDLRLVVAGSSGFTDSYVETLHGLAAKDERVLMPGGVFGSLLDELYSNAALFVLPSHLEGLPLTLLEAASFGVPIVASGIAPHVEVLRRDGPGRRLFTPGDEDALVCALQRAVGDLDGERAAADEVRRHVMANYDWDRAAEATERVYLSLAGGRGRRWGRHGSVGSVPVDDRDGDLRRSAFSGAPTAQL